MSRTLVVLLLQSNRNVHVRWRFGKWTSRSPEILQAWKHLTRLQISSRFEWRCSCRSAAECFCGGVWEVCGVWSRTPTRPEEEQVWPHHHPLKSCPPTVPPPSCRGLTYCTYITEPTEPSHRSVRPPQTHRVSLEASKLSFHELITELLKWRP